MSTSGLDPFLGGDRFATITPNDHGGVVWVASILCAIFTLLTVFLRCYAKRKYFGLDDWLAAAATVTAQAQYIAVFFALSDGLGKSYVGFSTSGIDKIGKAALVSQIFFLLSLCLAKISVVLLIRRLFSPDMFRHLIICDAILVMCALWGLGSILGVVIDCSPLRLMGPKKAFCSNLVSRWKAIGVVDAITEFLSVGMSAVIVWRLQMNVDRKFRVVVAFVPRLPLVVFAILHIRYTANFTNRPNTGVAFAAPMVYQQIELCYSLVSCTIPNLQGFLISFNTGMGLNFGYATQGYGSNSAGYQLSLMRKYTDGSRARPSANADLAKEKFRPEPVKYSASVVHPNGTDIRSTHSQEDLSAKSANSQDMIIKRDVQYDVRYD